MLGHGGFPGGLSTEVRAGVGGVAGVVREPRGVTRKGGVSSRVQRGGCLWRASTQELWPSAEGHARPVGTQRAGSPGGGEP